jgi:hypothetical protein
VADSPAPDPSPRKRDWRSARTAAAFVVAYALPVVVAGTHAFQLVDMALWRMDAGLDELLQMVAGIIGPSYVAGLVGATIATALGFLVRTIARARLRAGQADPLEQLRALASAHPRRVAALLPAPAVAWAALVAAHNLGQFDYHRSFSVLPGLILPVIVALLAHVALARRGFRALLAPTLDEAEAGAEQAHADGFTFDAVAVTRETRAAVGGLAAISAMMTAAMFVLPVSRMRDPAFVGALAAYVALTASVAFLFRRASRISIGLDGIFVRGSSRARFFGFRDIDGAEVRGSDLVLLRGQHVVLRLQLHGKDASRRDALLVRLQAAISRAVAERDDPATSFVSGASTADITRAAEGGADYRKQAVSREQLWAVLEGPAIDTASRRAAAEALSRSREPKERARLRIAAEQCAEPSVRIRMNELLADDPKDDIVGDANANEDARRLTSRTDRLASSRSRRPRTP